MKTYLFVALLLLSGTVLQAQQGSKESPSIRQGIELCNCFQKTMGEYHPLVQQLFIDLIFLGKDDQQAFYKFAQAAEQLPAEEQKRILKDSEALEKEESFVKIEKCLDAYEDLADMIDEAEEKEAIAFFDWLDANKACSFLQMVFADDDE